MILTLEPLLVIAAIFGLPVLAALGTAFTAMAWWAGSRRGGSARRWWTVAIAWLLATLLAVGGWLIFDCWQSREWGACFARPRETVQAAAIMVLLVGVCFCPAAWMVHRRLAADVRLDIDGALAGGAAAAGVWVAMLAIAIVVNRVAG